MRDDEARILKLAEGVLVSGLSPEEVCAGSPELLAKVKERLRWTRGVDAMIDQLFPSTPSLRRRHGSSPASLPPAEREDCRTFWRDMESRIISFSSPGQADGR